MVRSGVRVQRRCVRRTNSGGLQMRTSHRHASQRIRRFWSAGVAIAALLFGAVPVSVMALDRPAISTTHSIVDLSSPPPTPPAKTVVGIPPKNASPKQRPNLSTPASPTCINYTVAGGVALSAAMKSPGGIPMGWGADLLQPTSTTQFNGDYIPRSVPGPVGVTAISAQGLNVLMLINGTVWGWGQNSQGDLGVGDTIGRSVAAQAVGINGIVAISSGSDHALAIKSDGTIWAWGADGFGQLGVQPPPNNRSTTPVRVAFAFPASVVQVAAGSGTSLALDANGTVWTWGTPLGVSPTQLQVTPTAVSFAGNPKIVLIAIGTGDALAVDSTGILWSWGVNSFGELGNGTTTASASPVVVSGINGIAAIAAGQGFSLATDSSGRVWGWGKNDGGQLGIGNQVSPQTLPVQNTSLSGPVALAAGQDHAFALFASGSLYGWGDSGNGQVGTGFSTTYLTPQLVSISGVAQPSACSGPAPTGSGPNPGPAVAETLGGRPIDEKAVSCTCGGYPVDSATGNFYHEFTDLTIPGRGISINFGRTYNSLAASQASMLGFGWTHSYNLFLTFDGSGNPTVHEENAGTLPFSLSGSTYTAPARVLATLVKNGDGSFTLTRKDKSQFVFNPGGLLIKEVDRNGYATILAYNANNQLTSVTDPAGRQLVLGYNGSGQVSSLSDPASRSVTYQYDLSGNLQSVTDINGGITTFTYDSNHLLLTMKDPRNGVLTNIYDTSGRVTQQTDPMNNVTKFTYQSGSTLVTYPNGMQSLLVFQNNGLATRIDGYGSGLATNTAYSYDNTTMGVATITDSLGDTGKATWDSAGNLLSGTTPANQTTNYAYNPFNEPTTVKDALNAVTTNTYDGNGNLTSTSTPLSGTTSTVQTTFTYDPAHLGDLVQVTDPNGQIWKYAYDAYGNKAKSIDPLGNTTTYSYDIVGRMTSSVSPLGNVTGGNPSQYTTSYTNDAFGDALTITDPLGHVTTHTYDGNQNQTSVKDANQNTTTFTYDADNRETVETRPDSSTLKTSYDSDGNVTSQTDPLSNIVKYTYDSLDRRVSKIDALGRTTLYGYGGPGYLFSVSDPSGRITSYSYDTSGRLTSITYSDAATPNVAEAYDSDGQRTSMTDGSGTSQYTYDSLHRLTKSVNGTGATVSYGYDLKSQLTTVTYPGGTNVVTRAYDIVGRLTSITDWNGNVTKFAYDADSNLTTWTYPNTTIATWTYDRADNVSSIVDTTGTKNTVFLSFNYGRDAANQLTGENSQSYGYDAENRTTSAPPSSYTYDAADQLTQIAVTGGTTTTLAYDGGNQLNTFTVMSGPTQTQKYTYSYDNSGNRTRRVDQSNNTVNLSFDQANRLTRYSTTATYVYNGDGLRASKTVSGTAEAYTWNVADGLPKIITDGTTSYVTGPTGAPLEQVVGKTVYFYHIDQLGSVRALTNSRGTTVNTYNYDIWGNIASTTGTLANPFQYSGQYVDSESGFIYLRARYYDPATSQFISSDPKVSSTRHGYAYTSDHPLNTTDPTGLYDYDYRWWIGAISEVGTAEDVMGFFQLHMRQVFPFDTGQCDTVQLNASCNLSPNPAGYTWGWAPFHNPWPVKVTDVSCTSFTFTAEPGHPDYDPNSPGTITFSTYEYHGAVYLRQLAHTTSHWWDPIAPPQAGNIWSEMAKKLRNALLDAHRSGGGGGGSAW